MKKETKKDKEIKRWHQIVFYVLADKKQDLHGIAKLDSPVHLLIADELFKSIIHDHDLRLWRFHRMFIVYKKGFPGVEDSNQFKFKFFSTKEIYDEIKSKVKLYLDKNPILWDVLLDVKCFSCLEDNDIMDDHDDDWPLLIKKTWPHYICGISKMWLEMISEAKKDVYWKTYPEDLELFDRINYYEMVGAEMKRKWTSWANHAVFHHANLLFGGHPVNVAWFRKKVRLKKYKDMAKSKLIGGEVIF